jgi:hypothetical protein
MYDPPQREYERLAVVATYYGERLRQSIEAFQDAKEEFAAEASAAANSGFEPSTTPAEVQRVLSAKRRAVRKWQNLVAETEEAMERTPEGRAEAAREKRRAEAKAASEKLMSTVRRFRI